MKNEIGEEGIRQNQQHAQFFFRFHGRLYFKVLWFEEFLAFGIYLITFFATELFIQ